MGFDDFERWKPLTQVAKNWRQQKDASCRTRAEPKPSHDAPGMPGHAVERGGDNRVDLAGMVQQFGACRRRSRFTPNTLDQGHAHTLFKLAYLKADGGLTQIQTLGRSGEAAEFDDIDEGTEIVEIDAAHTKVFLMLCIICKTFLYGGGWCSIADDKQLSKVPMTDVSSTCLDKGRPD